MLTAEAMDAHNTFENPNTVKPEPFDHAELGGDRLAVTLPAKSVVLLRLE